MNLTSRDQGRYRPAVESAWLAHCATSGSAPNDKAAREAWYRSELKGRFGVESTKDYSGDVDALVEHFRRQFADATVRGWSDAQNKLFVRLARKAYLVAGSSMPFDSWLEHFMSSRCIAGTATRVRGFDRIMRDLAILANDDTWIRRTAEAEERRMRHVIRSLLADLDCVTGEIHDWNYVLAIWDQASQLPADIEDAPVDSLRLVMEILGSHLAKLCEEADIRPKDLASRNRTSSRASQPVEVPF